MNGSNNRAATAAALVVATVTLAPPTVRAAAAAPAVTAPAAAAPNDGLTLTEALRRAAHGNVDLQRERIAIDVSTANVLAAQGAFDFVLSGDATFSRTLPPPVRPTDVPTGSSTGLVTDLQLLRPLESGGQLSLSAQNTWRRINNPDLMTCGTAICNVYSDNLSLSFTQPLLRGFGSEIATANLRKQRIQHDLALLNRQARVANVIRDTVTAYWELAYQTQDLAIRRSAVDLARDQLRITQAQIDVGRAGQLALAAVQRAIADRQQDVAASEQDLMLRALDLQRLFGAPVPPRFAGYHAADAAGADPHDVDVAAEVGRALDSSPALKSLRMGVALSDIDVRVAENALRPQLDLNGSVGAVGRSRTAAGDAVDQVLRLQAATVSAGLVFSLPIQNRAARGAADVARLGGDSARLEAGDLELAIRDGVARFAARIQAAGRRVDFARAAVGFATQNLQAEQARFAVGQSTNNDVLMRQQELKEAEIKVARAIVDVLVNDAALSALTGEILDRYGVILRGS